jgi:hypothetical protein
MTTGASHRSIKPLTRSTEAAQSARFSDLAARHPKPKAHAVCAIALPSAPAKITDGIDEPDKMRCKPAKYPL